MIRDLLFASAAGAGEWTPAELFKNGEVGFWFDSSDYSTMSQSNTSQVDVTASGQPVGEWRNKITTSPGFKLVTGTTAARPVTKTASGKMSLVWDGVNDTLTSPDSGDINVTNGLSMFAGQRGGGTATNAIFLHMLTDFPTIIRLKTSNDVYFQSQSQNTISTEMRSITGPNILGVMSKIGTPIVGRVNGVASTGPSPTSGSSIGSQVRLVSDATLYSECSQAVFINRLLTAGEITLLEAFIGSKQ